MRREPRSRRPRSKNSSRIPSSMGIPLLCAALYGRAERTGRSGPSVCSLQGFPAELAGAPCTSAAASLLVQMRAGRRERDPTRLSRFEVLGAWLRVWTPHRDAEVPPVPVRRILAWTLAGLVVLGAAAVVAVPAIQDAKRRGDERDARALAAERARERRAIERAQVPHRGHAPRPRGLAGLSAAERLRLRSA